MPDSDTTVYPWSFPSRSFAIRAHGKQRYGKNSYVVHLDHVVSVLIRFGIRNSVLYDAAFLHDVIEDTDVDFCDLSDRFSNEVATIVDACTDGPGKTREEKKQHPYLLIPKTEGAIYVKLADRIANMEACFAEGKDDLLLMYRDEHKGFSAALYSNDAGPVTLRMWIYLDDLIKLVSL